MTDIFDNSAELDDEIAQFEADDGNTQKKESSGAAIAHLSLDAALNRKSRTLLKRNSTLTIVHVPDAEWISIIAATIKKMEKAPFVQAAVNRTKIAGVLKRVGQESLGYLEKDMGVLFVTHDPDEVLHEAVLAAADIRITLQPMTTELLRRLIHRVTGGVARGIRKEMADLDLSIILTIVRSGRTARQCVEGLARALDRRSAPAARSVPLLTELPLTENVKRWSADTLADLHDVKAGTLSPTDLIFGFLEGPPGTGKTLIAESLARTANWHFVSTSIGAWFASGDGALGGVAKNLKSFVDGIMSNEPAIGFLDELDALPNRATMDNRGLDWWTPVITLFLTEIDRLRNSGKRVLLLGATNYCERLDSALIRPGRLQQRITVLPPETQAEVAEVFRHYLGDELDAADLLKFASIAKGATPAAIEGWVKAARSLARLAKRPLVAADVIQQILPQELRSEEDLRSIAIHELGHAVVGHRLGHAVERVSIIAEGWSGGHTLMRAPSQVPTLQTQLDLVAIHLGGRAADMVLGQGANTGAERDLANATALLVAASDRQGLRDNLAYIPKQAADSVEFKTINEELQRQLQRSKKIVAAEREVILELSERLLQEKVLLGEAIAEALAPLQA